MLSFNSILDIFPTSNSLEWPWLKYQNFAVERALQIDKLTLRRVRDYPTWKESTPKCDNSAAPICMSELLAKHLRAWLDKRYTPNAEGYLFINSQGRPYSSRKVVR